MIKFFEIRAKGNRTADVMLYGTVAQWASVNARDFARKLKELEGDYDHVNLRINSPGGDVFEGFAIFNTIKASPLIIDTYIDGMAASMGSILALAGDTVHMAQNAQMMIHQSAGGVIGQASKIKQYAELLESVNKTLAEVYADKTGKDVDWVMDNWMKDNLDKWFTAKEAKNAGLVDVIIDNGVKKKPAEKAAMEDMEMDAIAAFYNDALTNTIDNQTDSDMNYKEIAKALGLPEDATESQIIAAIKSALDTAGKVQAVFMAMGKKLGVITDANKERFERLAKADIDLAVDFLNDSAGSTGEQGGDGNGGEKKPKTEKDGSLAELIAELKKQNGESGGSQAKGREDWTMTDWEKKDGAGLKTMIKENPDQYKQLYKARYGKELTDEQMSNIQKSIA